MTDAVEVLVAVADCVGDKEAWGVRVTEVVEVLVEGKVRVSVSLGVPTDAKLGSGGCVPHSSGHCNSSRCA